MTGSPDLAGLSATELRRLSIARDVSGMNVIQPRLFRSVDYDLLPPLLGTPSSPHWRMSSWRMSTQTDCVPSRLRT